MITSSKSMVAISGLTIGRRRTAIRLHLTTALDRIHGSNEPETIGAAVSSGCIRMLNEDLVDLYDHVKVGTRVVVLR